MTVTMEARQNTEREKKKKNNVSAFMNRVRFHVLHVTEMGQRTCVSMETKGVSPANTFIYMCYVFVWLIWEWERTPSFAATLITQETKHPHGFLI